MGDGDGDDVITLSKVALGQADSVLAVGGVQRVQLILLTRPRRVLPCPVHSEQPRTGRKTSQTRRVCMSLAHKLLCRVTGSSGNPGTDNGATAKSEMASSSKTDIKKQEAVVKGFVAVRSLFLHLRIGAIAWSDILWSLGRPTVAVYL